jgi:hypothetical protein
MIKWKRKKRREAKRKKRQQRLEAEYKEAEVQ